MKSGTRTASIPRQSSLVVSLVSRRLRADFAARLKDVLINAGETPTPALAEAWVKLHGESWRIQSGEGPIDWATLSPAQAEAWRRWLDAPPEELPPESWYSADAVVALKALREGLTASADRREEFARLAGAYSDEIWSRDLDKLVQDMSATGMMSGIRRGRAERKWLTAARPGAATDARRDAEAARDWAAWERRFRQDHDAALRTLGGRSNFTRDPSAWHSLEAMLGRHLDSQSLALAQKPPTRDELRTLTAPETLARLRREAEILGELRSRLVAGSVRLRPAKLGRPWGELFADLDGLSAALARLRKTIPHGLALPEKLGRFAERVRDYHLIRSVRDRIAPEAGTPDDFVECVAWARGLRNKFPGGVPERFRRRDEELLAGLTTQLARWDLVLQRLTGFFTRPVAADQELASILPTWLTRLGRPRGRGRDATDRARRDARGVPRIGRAARERPGRTGRIRRDRRALLPRRLGGHGPPRAPAGISPRRGRVR